MRGIAIIPARQGSKRIANKNIKKFHGKPIIHYSIEAAISSAKFERIIVSTDSEEIADICKAKGAEVPFLRSKNLSDDHSSVIDVVRNFINSSDVNVQRYEIVTLIYATAPLIRVEDLKKAINLIVNNDFVVSVTPYDYPIQRALRLKNKGQTITMIEEQNFLKRSQDFQQTYHDAGQFIVGKTDAWLKKTPFIDSLTAPLPIPSFAVQDIDNESDWRLAEYKYELLKKMKFG